jgi:hypothetical protein
MKKLSLIIALVFFFDVSFSQHIEEVFVGRSLERTIDQGKYKGHEFLETNGDVASFCVVSQYGRAWLNLHASPKSKIVWYGTSSYKADNKQQAKDNFQKMKKSFYEKYGEPDKIKRKEIEWVLEDCIIILRRIRDFNSYTVISTVAYRKISSEIAIKKIRNQQE